MITKINLANIAEVYNTDTDYINRTFKGILHFDYDAVDISFTDCYFEGVIFIKNTGGTVTFNGLNKGGFIICNKPIPETLTGVGDVPDTNF